MLELLTVPLSHLIAVDIDRCPVDLPLSKLVLTVLSLYVRNEMQVSVIHSNMKNDLE